MGHDHDHGHDMQRDHGRAFFIATALNLSFVAVGSVYGVLAHSMALLADAAHNLGDVLGLVLAWGATVLTKRRATRHRTYGFRRSSILAAFLNSFVLLFATGGVAWEAVRRFFEPAVVASKTVMVVAGIGIFVNLGSGLLFTAGRKGDINIQGAFLHLMGDAATSFAVVVAAVILHFTGWAWLDPAMSLVIAGVILVGTWKLLRSAINLILDAVPEEIDPDAVRSYLGGLPGVTGVHHLHIWPLSTTETALTAHLVMPIASERPEFLGEIAERLRHDFQIGHATIQVDASVAEECAPCSERPSV